MRESRRRAATWIILAGWLVAVPALASCGTGPAAGSATPAVVVSDDPGRLDAPFVTLMRSGGLDPTLERLVVSGRGLVVVTHDDGSYGERQLTEAEFGAVVDAVHQADLGALASSYPAEGADMYEYTVIADGTHVTASEVAIPESMRRLVDLLEPYMANG